MNRNPNTITRILRSGARLCLCVALLPFAVQVFAHGGMEHVIGTVVKVENNNLTVKTAKGNVDVELDEKSPITITRILRSGARRCLFVSLLPFAVQVFAHGGMEHVIGTVVKVENNNLTVKTAKGNVDVKLDEKT